MSKKLLLLTLLVLLKIASVCAETNVYTAGAYFAFDKTGLNMQFPINGDPVKTIAIIKDFAKTIDKRQAAQMLVQLYQELYIQAANDIKEVVEAECDLDLEIQELVLSIQQKATLALMETARKSAVEIALLNSVLPVNLVKEIENRLAESQRAMMVKLFEVLGSGDVSCKKSFKSLYLETINDFVNGVRSSISEVITRYRTSMNKCFVHNS